MRRRYSRRKGLRLSSAISFVSMTGDRSWVVGVADAGLRLDKFLAGSGRLGSRSQAASAIERGKVYLNDREARPADAATRLTTGDLVKVWIDRPGSARRPAPLRAREGLRIEFEDDFLIVVDKPAGMLTVPLARSGDPSILDSIQRYLRSPKRRPFVVHRIDRDTSGLVIFAKDPDTQERLKSQFRQREPERIYWAVVYGHPNPPEGTWQDQLIWDSEALVQRSTHPRDPRGKEAISRYRILEAFDAASLVEVRLVTGKRNQIRVQAKLRGHPLVGERRYTIGPDTLRPIPFARQALHARGLAFRHPRDGRELAFEASVPRDMAALLADLRRRTRRAGAQ
jgi:23S rRNA pseudouridine1911/1915/1917 synthase